MKEVAQKVERPSEDIGDGTQFLVLVGAYALRHVMIDVGQDSTWTLYPSQYGAEMLERMERD